MQTDVNALVILYVDGNLLRQMQWMAIFGFQALEVCPHHIVGFAGGHALGEFADMIGGQLPPGFLVMGTANLDHDSIDRVIVRVPDRSEDKSIGIRRFQFLRRWSSDGGRHDRQTRGGKKEKKQEAERKRAREQKRSGSSTSHPRLPPPLPLPLRRSRLRRPST